MPRKPYVMTPEQIRQWRHEHHYSQLLLANRLGVSERTVAGWEQGRFSPAPFLSLALLALAQGQTVQSLRAAS